MENFFELLIVFILVGGLLYFVFGVKIEKLLPVIGGTIILVTAGFLMGVGFELAKLLF